MHYVITAVSVKLLQMVNNLRNAFDVSESYVQRYSPSPFEADTLFFEGEEKEEG
jgi:uncharacterized protein YutD